MSKCDLEIVLDRKDRTYRPGETISGFVGVTVNKSCTCRGLTITREWRTHGRGNRTSGGAAEQVVFEGEWTAGEQHVHPFEFTVPDGPATYHGHHLNVDWYVAARADIPWAFDPKAAEELVLVPDPERPTSHGPLHAAGPEGAHRAVTSILVAAGGAVTLGFAAMFLCSGGALLAGGEVLGGLIFTSFPLAFAALGVFLLLRGLRGPLARRRFGEIAFRVEPDAARGGESVTVTVGFTPLRTVQLDGVRARLWAQERCVSGSGTNKKTHTFALWDEIFELEGPRTVEAGHPFEVTGQVTLPPDPAPSFAASENAVQWRIEAVVDQKGWLDWKQSWLLTVRP